MFRPLPEAGLLPHLPGRGAKVTVPLSRAPLRTKLLVRAVERGGQRCSRRCRCPTDPVVRSPGVLQVGPREGSRVPPMRRGLEAPYEEDWGRKPTDSMRVLL